MKNFLSAFMFISGIINVISGTIWFFEREYEKSYLRIELALIFFGLSGVLYFVGKNEQDSN